MSNIDINILKTLLSGYKIIKAFNEIIAQQSADNRNMVEAAIFASFKRYGISDVSTYSIIQDFMYCLENTLICFKKRCQRNNKIKLYKVIYACYFSKKNLSKKQIEKNAGISASNLSRELNKSLVQFAEVLEEKLTQKNYTFKQAEDNIVRFDLIVKNVYNESNNKDNSITSKSTSKELRKALNEHMDMFTKSKEVAKTFDLLVTVVVAVTEEYKAYFQFYNNIEKQNNKEREVV